MEIFSVFVIKCISKTMYPLIGFKLVARIRPNANIGTIHKNYIKCIKTKLYKLTNLIIVFSTINLVILHNIMLFG